LKPRNKEINNETLEFWRKKVCAYPGPPQLPRKKHDLGGVAKFNRVSSKLQEKYWEQIKSVARTKSITSNSLILAIFAEVIQFYSENAEFTLTVTRSERPVSLDNNFLNVVGEFTNVMLCPITKKQGKGIIDKAISIHSELTSSLEYEEFGGLETIRLLRKEQNDPHISFPIVFTSFLGIIDSSIQMKGLDLALAYQQTQTPQLSLDHQVYEIDGQLVINWDFDSNIFSNEQMKEMLDCFQHLLEAFAIDHETSITLAPETLKLRQECNQTTEEFSNKGSELLHDLVLEQSKKSPHAVAIIDQEFTLTYQELVELSTSLAIRLQELGVEPGSSVALVLEKGWEQVVGTIGVMMTGACYLPLNPSHPDDRLRNIITLADCKIAVVHDATIVKERNWQEKSDGSTVQSLKIHTGLNQERKNDFKPVDTDPDNVAYVIFTSGSTGTPKGVEIAHNSAVNTCLDINKRFALKDKTVTFGISSLGFDLSVWDIFGTLGTGGTLVMCKPDGTIDPDYWWEQVQKHGVTMWNTVPTSFEMLVQSRPEKSIMPIKSVLLSGDAITINMVMDAMEVFPELQINALGGATEASIWSNYHIVSENTFNAGTDLVPYGRPLSNQTMLIVDDNFNYRPTGAVGDIYIGGIGVAKGYFKDPELTNQKFIENQNFGRLYETGDLGRYLSNGEIEIIGRNDSQVKVGGQRVELAEIEHCAEELEYVDRSAVVHISGAGSRLVGFITGTSDIEQFEEKVRLHVEDSLPDYMAPQNWIVLDEIPHTANNKVDMKTLRNLARSSVISSNDESEGNNSTEVSVILALAAQVLKVPSQNLSPKRSLSDQGLTSLYAVQLINLLSKAWDQRLSYTLIFNYPTAAKLADYLSGKKNEQQAPKNTKEEHVKVRTDEPIAIIARACRLPGQVNSPEEFFDMLMKGTDCMSDVPENRFDMGLIYNEDPDVAGASYTKRGAFIGEIEYFDNELFEIPLAEASAMDPQQRLMLEVAYETFLNAGYHHEELKGSSTGIFIGQMNYDWMMAFEYSKEYAGTGSAPSITSNRISFCLDLSGPSMTIDTACSSSLVAVDSAIEKLRNGDCNLALAGGANLILSPEPYVFTCQARMLSKGGRCATFDSSANGIARGEGVGAVLLKRLSDAERDGDSILGVIKSSAVNQDGRSASLTAPSGLAQEAVIESALLEAKLKGSDIDYIECHGTGTPLGDPIEVEALKNVLGKGRRKTVVLGALKTNLGHLEGAAGIIGLIKTLEVVRNRRVPPNIHFKELNPKIDIHGFPVVIPSQTDVYLQEDKLKPVRAGISSFGYGGTNAHVILESYAKQDTCKDSVWLFTGQGSLVSGSAKALFDSDHIFNTSLTRYSKLITDATNEPVLELLIENSTANSKKILQTRLQQPALVAMQLAQIDMWRSRAILPKAVVGHSIGEYSAAVACGVMSSKQALELAILRGTLMEKCEPGYMASIALSSAELAKVLPADTVISAENAPNLCVVSSGNLDSIEKLRKHSEQIVQLDVSHAFHSPHMETAAELFSDELSKYNFEQPSNGIEFYSSLTGTVEKTRLTDGQYWADQIVKPVKFLSAINSMKKFLIGDETFIELGPKTTLIGLGKKILTQYERICWIGSSDTTRGTPSMVKFKKNKFSWDAPQPRNPINQQKVIVPLSISSDDFLKKREWVLVKELADKQAGNCIAITRSDVEIALPQGWEICKVDSTDDLKNILLEASWTNIAYISSGDEKDINFGLDLIQKLVSNQLSAELHFFVESTHQIDFGLLGMCRTSRLEHPEVKVNFVEYETDQLTNGLMKCISAPESEIRIDKDGSIYVPRLVEFNATSKSKDIQADSTYVISGGLGALGLEAAKILVELGAKNIVLLGRKKCTPDSMPSEFGKIASKARVEYFSCDISKLPEVEVLAAQIDESWPAISGVIHTAGVLSDAVLMNQTEGSILKAYEGKVHGAINLYDLLQPSDFIVLYSSVAATLGSSGQANYSAANTTLDALAEQWSNDEFSALSIQWGAWSEIGMAAESGSVERVRSLGYGVIDIEQGVKILPTLLNSGESGIICASPVDWSKVSQLNKQFSYLSTTENENKIWEKTSIFEIVRESLAQFIDSGNIQNDLPFMEAGLSSLDLVQFRQNLLSKLPDSVNIPAQFVFNYPTIEDVVDHLTEQMELITSPDNVDSGVWEKLNDVDAGKPIFLIGGVMGTAEKTFGSMARNMTVPVYGAMPEIPWDLDNGDMTLESLASSLLESLKQEIPQSSYTLGGLSFGATLAIEMGIQLQDKQEIDQVILLDPRHMAPFKAPENPAPFEMLVENYLPSTALEAKAFLFQCEVPSVEKQSEMMLEASRSFMSDQEILSRCENFCTNLIFNSVEGHHFNFLFKHNLDVISKLESELGLVVKSIKGNEPIAIVGSACRLPGDVSSVDDFWSMLVERENCIEDIPVSRFDIDEIYNPDPDAVGKSYTRKGGFVSSAEYFDYEFFGISEAEAKVMDPQQRMLLEVSYQAFNSAGYDKKALKGTKTSVHIGLANDDWTSMGRDDEAHNPHFGAGVSSSISSNRISYLLGLTGPSMTIDTACSSSLVAVDLAVEKLRSGVSDLALVGGVNVILHHRMYVSACATNALSINERCASFDEAADGYCRGEGAGAIIIKRLSDAQANGDNILAVIKGSAVNQDGKSVSLTAPNGIAQQSVIHQALTVADVKGQEVDYIECHGTGTPLGDPIEVGALKEVLGQDREKPVVLGAVKSNIGHLEGAAGVVGLIKAVEVLRHRSAPGIVHFNTLNENIDLSDFNAVISSNTTPLKSEGKLIAGISSFGFGGTNAHVVLESYDNAVENHVEPVVYNPRFLPWRRLPNPLLSRSIKDGFAATLTGVHASLWQDHKILGDVLVPAASHITMLGGACLLKEDNKQAIGVEVQHILMSQPLKVTDDAIVVHCVNQDGQWSIESESNNQRAQFASAQDIRLLESSEQVLISLSVDEITERCTSADYMTLYKELEGQGVQFGAGYQNLENLFISEHEGIAQVEVTLTSTAEKSLTLLNPASLDAGIQLLGLCAMKSCGVCVPFTVEKSQLFLLDEQPEKLWAYAQITTISASSVEGNITLFSESGQVYAVLDGVTCRQVTAGNAVTDCLYETEWIAAPTIKSVQTSVKKGLLISKAAIDTELPTDWSHTMVEDITALNRVLAEERWSHVALASQGTEEDVALGLALIQWSIEKSQEVKSEPTESIPAVVLLPKLGAIFDAGLWGIARTARLESPSLTIKCIEASDADLNTALTRGLMVEQEDDISVDVEGNLRVARLQRYRAESQTNGQSSIVIRKDATYVISGGLGALGLVAAHHLVEQGAEHLVLLSRTSYTEANLPEAVTALKQHARVDCIACDVAQADSVEGVKQQLREAQYPDIAGIVHTAGVLTDGTLVNQDADKLAQAYGAKVHGAENLHNVLNPSDFMVLYSSAAATFGSAGQASYAAANATLDRLAQHWSAKGVPVLSIQWGAWSDGGMAVRHDAVKRAEVSGYGSISNELGMSVFNELLASGKTGPVCVSPMDWSRVILTASMISRFKPRKTRLAANAVSAQSQIKGEKLLTIIREAAKSAMGKVVEDDAPLMANGLDSLSSVVLSQTLGQELGLSLGAVFALNYPNITDMAKELGSQLAEKGSPTPEVRSVPKTFSRTEEPIAIVGTACRLPGDVSNPEEFWEMLYAGKDCVTDIPKTRFDIDEVYDADRNAVGKSYTRRAAFMSEVEDFDNDFFGIPVAEARAMDPQQRLLMEVSCEAFYRAGYDMDSLKSAPVGIFVGQMNHDWAHMNGDKNLVDPYFGAGSSASITSNRMSYIFGLTGPSMTLDTACSSSLVAVDLAVEKLRKGDCSAALVGGVNVMLSHRSFVGCCASNMLSFKGRCASFDESADGYCRGEGVGAVVLKRLSDAQANGDEILSVIRSTSVNQDGRSASLTAPNGLAQEAVINRALELAGLLGKDIDYIECHGTGTPLGDPIEVGALKNVLSKDRTKPVFLGTVKTNVGHLEGAAGVIGLIKAVEVVRHGSVPPNVHFKNLNPKINLSDFDAVIPTKPVHLGDRDKYYAGVSSFGFGGTNAHVIIESYGEKCQVIESDPIDVMLFTGQGSIKSGVATPLYQSDAVFKESFDRNLKLVNQLTGYSISELLLNQTSSNTDILKRTELQQPALVALQLSQLEMWKARGVLPQKVLGHSIGEFAAAVAAGVLKADDALELAVHRGRLMSECEPGGMAALMLPVSSLNKPLSDEIVIAAENGTSMTVLSGPVHLMEEELNKFYPDQFTMLPVSHAFHSPMMNEAARKFEDILSEYEMKEPETVEFYSTLTGQKELTGFSNPSYWSNQIIKCVKFLDAVNRLFESTPQPITVIEIGPTNTLINMAKRIIPNAGINWVESADISLIKLHKGKNNE